MRKEIEDRLVKFAANVLLFVNENLAEDLASCYLAEQITRSSMSAALNYGEVEGSQSRKDFIHKSSIVLKELRESNINLRLIKVAELSKNKIIMEALLDESNQLVSIFHRAVLTAKKNQQKE